MFGAGSLQQLPQLRPYASRRASSYDVSGGNQDWWTIAPGSRSTLMESDAAGCIKHIWMTAGGDDLFPRRAVLRMWWDGEASPSVECPLGDFFGMAFGRFKNFVSVPLQLSPEDGRGMNCWWPMPFSSARIEVESECENPISLYFYIDWEEPLSLELGVASLESGDPVQLQIPNPKLQIARFHCQWRRENPTDGWITERVTPENVVKYHHDTKNLSDEGNYVILEAIGNGIYAGCHLDIDCFERHGNEWYGEGDDMIVIDGEPWPPRLHGTGTEDYFCTAWGPTQEYCAPYHGITLNSGDEEWRWRGKNSCYRFHIEDPIRFEKSIRVSIEHGHANKMRNDYCSTAYWYQIEPHGAFPALPGVQDRLARL
ncbi:MAG: glycoside hydrolase family 172 protein [Fimbriimonadales bacterium]